MEDDVAIEIDTGGQRHSLIPVQVERQMGYGSVVGLEDEELADPAELERQVMLAEWGPILAIPIRGHRSVIRPCVDESGQLDWGAFGTVDFDRLRPPFNKALYKADRLQEDLRNALIMLSVVRERLTLEAGWEVLELVRSGDVELDAIADGNRRAYAKWYLRARRLRKEIRELREFGHQLRRQWPGDISSG